MIIRADTDLNRTVSGAVGGSFVNAGQMCVGVRRIIVHGSIYDYFLIQPSRKLLNKGGVGNIRYFSWTVN